MNTRMAHPNTMFKSEVGANRPSRLLRLERADRAKIPATNGAKSMNCSPMLLFTSLLTVSTIHSAASCRLESGITLMPWVRYRHTPKMDRITAQELT